MYSLTQLYDHFSRTARGTITTAGGGAGGGGASLTALSNRIEELQSLVEDKQVELERLMQSVSKS